MFSKQNPSAISDIKALDEGKKYDLIIQKLEDEVIDNKNILEDVSYNETQLAINYYYGKACYTLRKYMKAVSSFHYAIIIGIKIVQDCKEQNTVSASINDTKLYLVDSYFYKGSALYTLKKYLAAIKCFNAVDTDYDISLSANLYKGFCYENLMNLKAAEDSFKKVLDLIKSAPEQYTEGKELSLQAKKALIYNLIKQDKFEELIKIYNLADSNINTTDETGNNLLMYAITSNAVGIVKKLLEKNADPMLKNAYGESALSYAVDNNNESIVKTILLTQPDLVNSNDETKNIMWQARELLSDNIENDVVEVSEKLEELKIIGNPSVE